MDFFGIIIQTDLNQIHNLRPGIDERKKIQEMWFKGVNWIHLASDRDQWQIYVNVILNFWVHREL